MEGTSLRLAAIAGVTAAKAKRGRGAAGRHQTPSAPSAPQDAGSGRRQRTAAPRLSRARLRRLPGPPSRHGRAGPSIAASSCPCRAGAAAGSQLCPHNVEREGRERERGGKRKGRGSACPARRPALSAPLRPLPAAPARLDDALPPASPAPPPPGRRCRRHFAALSLPLSRARRLRPEESF